MYSISEEWRPVKDWPYEVSSLGRVRSYHAGLIKAHPNQDGYLKVTLSKGPAYRTCKVHHLVLEAFIGPKPFAKACARHKDNNRQNNCKDNLCWGTYQENADDRKNAGNTAKPWAKLSPTQVGEIRTELRAGKRQKDIAKAYGVTPAVISNINRGATYKDL